VILDPFAGSCNTLFWILQHLPNSEGIAFESDPQVFNLTRRNLAILNQRTISHIAVMRNSSRSVACPRIEVSLPSSPRRGALLDELQGLDLCRTAPAISEIIEELVLRFSKHKMISAIQVYEKVSAPSLNQIRTMLDWNALRIYDINEKGRNHGILLGSIGWAPKR
jgi:hypothetical protein